MHSSELVFGSASKYVSSERVSPVEELEEDAPAPAAAAPPPPARRAPAFLCPPVMLLRLPVTCWFRACISWKRLFRIVMRFAALAFLSA